MSVAASVDWPMIRTKLMGAAISEARGTCLDGEDLIQDAIVGMLIQERKGVTIRNIHGYLYRSLRNAANEWRRRDGGMMRAMEPDGIGDVEDKLTDRAALRDAKRTQAGRFLWGYYTGKVEYAGNGPIKAAMKAVRR